VCRTGSSSYSTEGQHCRLKYSLDRNESFGFPLMTPFLVLVKTPEEERCLEVVSFKEGDAKLRKSLAHAPADHVDRGLQFMRRQYRRAVSVLQKLSSQLF
tara:strand:- start:600 stop:899 length:300 start_codon:yes stop_codon:yes gene_type:complete